MTMVHTHTHTHTNVCSHIKPLGSVILGNSLQSKAAWFPRAHAKQGCVFSVIQDGVQHTADLREGRAVLRPARPARQHYVIPVQCL